MASTLSWTPLEDVLVRFEVVGIEDFYVGAALIGSKVDLVLTCNRILANFDRVL